MFYVVYTSNAAVVRIFKAEIEEDCWEFIRDRLSSTHRATRVNAVKLRVTDNKMSLRTIPSDVKQLFAMGK